MATMANPPAGALPVEDPFVSSHSADSQRSRYSGFDNQNFSLFANGSPSQAKRALEAHLSETERRLNDASRLGVVLVKQRQELTDRLRDVESQQTGDEIGPDLRHKLSELEREVSDISRETARIFIPKSRAPSGEGPDVSVFSSQAQNSPSKVHAPSRKQRNQPQTRVNDVKLATEISTNLLSQIRDLQAGYAEKDEALRLVNAQKSELEVNLDGLHQRLRALDESEQRFKDENWSLETQVHDLTAAQRETIDREQRLTHNLSAVTTSKSALEREFEELKQTHSKLSEEHVTTRKQHESELGTLRRNATSNETELTALNKKVEELTSQNKELAKAVTYRLRDGDRAVSQDMSFMEGDDDEDQVTPEHSPPPSPSKATPRHGALESETLKSSLHHAHRMIQNLKNNIHREKTEKFELKRLLQEARDDLESRKQGVDSAKKKNGKQQEILKKPGRLDRLGAARSAKDEIILDDPDWEDHSPSGTPSKPPVTRTMPGGYITATENSESFQTANENENSSTETDAFQTGVETLDGNSDSDDLTETESGAAQDGTLRKKPSPLNRYSMLSTASTSDDEARDFDVQTPVQTQHPKYKLRIGRGNARKSSGKSPVDAAFNDSPNMFDSPASLASSSGTPGQGQSLFAELGNLSDAETEESNTPQSVGVRSQINSPEMAKKNTLPSRLRAVQSSIEKPVMVDTMTMTEEKQPALGDAEPVAAPKEVIPPVVLNFAPILSQSTEPSLVSASAHPVLEKSTILSQHIEPYEAPKPIQSPLGYSAIVSRHSEPMAPPSPKEKDVAAPAIQEVKSDPLSFSAVTTQETAPHTAPSSSFASNALAGLGTFGNVFRRNKSEKNLPISVAEDDTSGSEQIQINSGETNAEASSGETRVPFQAIDGNAQASRSIAEKAALPATKPVGFSATNESTQTMLSAKDIDKLFKVNSALDAAALPSSPRKSRELRRPGSSGSNRSAGSPPPPLPAKAKQVIAAASQRGSVQSTSSGHQPVLGAMGPPIMSASAYRASQSYRPKTPVGSSAMPSPVRKGSVTQRAPPSVTGRSGASTPATRRSSVSSFASELDQRFNIGSNTNDNQAFDPNTTDPRMIQAITQTMIGEYLWKYTRKTGRDHFSSSRHQRFFWVHPYTRTLYWSEQDPATAGRTELKAKSVAIQAVRVVTDDNPSPPGLHRKSIIIVTPGRNIKMTASTSQRHETWFNALSYLLLKTGTEEEDADGVTAEDVEEFNPGGFRSSSRATGRSRASASSYASRHTAHTQTSTREHPTLHNATVRANQQRSQSVQPGGSLSNRLSSIFRTPQSLQGSMTSRYSRQTAQSSLHEASEAHDSAEDLRKTIVAKERGSSGLENVRACCDGKRPTLLLSHDLMTGNFTKSRPGKHDVGSLSRAHKAEASRPGKQHRSISQASHHSRKRSESRQSATRKQHLEMDPANIT
jgi:predicted  nucleic acid-binding Zn-ribbon protein